MRHIKSDMCCSNRDDGDYVPCLSDIRYLLLPRCTDCPEGSRCPDLAMTAPIQCPCGTFTNLTRWLHGIAV